MERFNLDTWLQNKSRKVVTRDGRTVEILKWTRKDNVHPIIFTVIDSNGTEQAHYCNTDGICTTRTRPNDLDLFFSEDDDLTDFESKLYSMISDVWQDYMLGNEVNLVQVVKENSPDILKSAKEEFFSTEPSPTILNLIDYGMPLEQCYVDWIVDWIKSVVKHDEKPEWSEEDEENRLLVSKIILDYDDISQGDVKRLIDWLKSIRDDNFIVNNKEEEQ